jgi:hypothetical protein
MRRLAVAITGAAAVLASASAEARLTRFVVTERTAAA